MKFTVAILLLACCVALSASAPAQADEKRGVLDFVANTFGINGIMQTLGSMTGNVKDQFFLLLEKLMFAGTTAWQQAKPILDQLVKDMMLHAENAKPLLSAAVASLTGIVQNHFGKRELLERGIADSVAQFFNLNGIISQLTGTASAMKDQLLATLAQFLFAGKEAYAQAQLILAELVQNLIGHTSNAQPLLTEAIAKLKEILATHLGKRDAEIQQRAIIDYITGLFGLGSIMPTIQALTGNLQSQFYLILEKLLFAGQQAWSQAIPVFNSLVASLSDHVSANIMPAITLAMSQLQNILQNFAGKRSLERSVMDSVASLFNMSGVLGQLTTVGLQMKEQFLTVLAQFLFAGKEALAQAQLILGELVQNLVAHGSNAQPLLTEAIAKLKEILAAHIGKRDAEIQERAIMDFISNMFGLSSILPTIQTLAGGLQTQFYTILEKVMFAGQQAIAQALPIITNMGSQLAQHLTGDKVQQLIQQTIAQLTAIVQGLGKREALERGIMDSVANIFGMNGILGALTNAGANIKDQFLGLVAQFLFAGQEALSQAKPIFNGLVNDLLTHTGNAVPLIQAAMNKLKEILASAAGKREAEMHERAILDTMLSVFGLTGLGETLSTMAAGLQGQLGAVLTQLLFAGKEALAQAQLVFNQLVQSLVGHAGNAGPLVTAAIAQLQAILQTHLGKREASEMIQARGLGEILANMFGMNGVWGYITSLAGNIKDTFISVLTALMFAGTAAWAQAAPIISKLVQDLLLHVQDAGPLVQTATAALQAILAGSFGKREVAVELQRGFWDTLSNFFGLGSVWSTITSVASQLQDQFFAVLSQLMFAGTTAWNAATPVFAQLVNDLIQHGTNAAPLLTEAIAKLKLILALAAGKREVTAELQRGFFDSLASFFGLGQIWSFITDSADTLKTQFLSTLTSLFLAGTNAWSQAKPVLMTLINELTAHGISGITQHVGTAIQGITAILQGNVAKRELEVRASVFDLISGLTGFDFSGLFSMLSSIHGNVMSQFTAVLGQLFTSSSAIIAAAKVILKDLYDQLKQHLNDGTMQQILQDHVNQLVGIVTGAVGKRDLASLLGLDNVASQLASAGIAIKQQFMTLVGQLIFASQSVYAQGMQVVKQLIADLKAHSENAIPLISQAVASLLAIIKQ